MILLQFLRVMLHAIKSGRVYSVTYSVSCDVALCLHACSTPAPRLLHALKLNACDGELAVPGKPDPSRINLIIRQVGHGDFTLVGLNFTDYLNLSSTPGFNWGYFHDYKILLPHRSNRPPQNTWRVSIYCLWLWKNFALVRLSSSVVPKKFEKAHFCFLAKMKCNWHVRLKQGGKRG